LKLSSIKYYKHGTDWNWRTNIDLRFQSQPGILNGSFFAEQCFGLVKNIVVIFAYVTYESWKERDLYMYPKMEKIKHIEPAKNIFYFQVTKRQPTFVLSTK
jgi:hypothetical protein